MLKGSKGDPDTGCYDSARVAKERETVTLLWSESREST